MINIIHHFDREDDQYHPSMSLSDQTYYCFYHRTTDGELAGSR